MTLKTLSMARLTPGRDLRAIGFTMAKKRFLGLSGDSESRDSLSLMVERPLILSCRKLRRPFLTLIDQYLSVESDCTSRTSPSMNLNRRVRISVKR